jgi:vacuolar-type H+-ATPase catalytic subunit A/Vma1
MPSNTNTIEQDELVFPALMSVYRDQGYELGYLRGRNDVLASLLEEIEEYLRENPRLQRTPRELLYGFADFLDRRLGETAASHEVCDGLGI